MHHQVSIPVDELVVGTVQVLPGDQPPDGMPVNGGMDRCHQLFFILFNDLGFSQFHGRRLSYVKIESISPASPKNAFPEGELISSRTTGR